MNIIVAPGTDLGPRWPEVRHDAEQLLADGRARDAFRLALRHQAARPSEEAGAFLCETFRQADLRFAMVMLQGIGNMVMLTPAIRALKRLFPCSRLEVVGKYPALDVIKGWSLVDACTEVDAYDPTGERDALLLSMWSGVFQRRYENAPAAGAAPQVVISFNDPMRHESEFHLDMARMLGFGEQKPDPYCVTEEVPLPFCGDGKVALLADTSNPDPEWQKKRWPYFRQLAGRLLERGFQVGLIGGPMEAQAFEPSDWPPGVIALMGKYSIPQTAYLIEQADLLIANDSGPAHLSGAVGTEAYVIFGPTLESKNLPLGPDVHVIKSDVGCRPCQYLESWAECRRHTCIEGITVEQVLDAIQGHEAPASPLSVSVPVAPARRDQGLVKVDLGCGRFKRKGHVGIDKDPHSDADIICDVTRGIPLATDSVDYLVADNLLEHVGDGLVCLMNEIWRVCKPGADVEMTVPLLPSAKAVADPTDSRHFTADTFACFDPQSAKWRPCGASSGLKPFRVLSSHKLAGEVEVVLTPDKATHLPQPIARDRDGSPSVCFMSHNQPGAGGAEKAMHEVANRLVECGHQVTVLYNERPFIHSLPVEAPPDARYRIQWVEGADLGAFHRAAARAVADGTIEADICLPLWRATCSELIDECRARNTPVGIWCQNVQYPPQRSNRSIFRLADFVVAVTPYARSVLQRRFGRTQDVFVIPNAAAEPFFANYAERKGRDLNRFVFFGRLADEQKGLVTLCEALAPLKEDGAGFSLDVIGSGPDLALMRSRIGSLGLGEHVRFLGWKSAEELAVLLPGYDLCILPSNFEGCSLAVVESMAVGIPIITTTAGGTPWLITDRQHGVLVPPNQPGLLTEAVKWARDHAGEMSLMARWAHKRALRRFHWERVVRDYRRLLGVVRAGHALPDAPRRAG